MVEVSRDHANPVVVSPVPWVPPLVPLPEAYARYRRVPGHRFDDTGLEVWHPRVVLPPGSRFQHVEAATYRRTLKRVVREVARAGAVDLVHAHFIYPEGVVAAGIGRELGVPVLTTEHAHWQPWMTDRPRVWTQVREALSGIELVTAVSEPVRRGVEALAGNDVRSAVVPNVLDEHVFTPGPSDARVPGRILFAGIIRRVKGFDVLLQALSRLRARGVDAHLQVVGDPIYPGYRRDAERDLALMERLGMTPWVEFVGQRDEHGVAEAMRRASVVAVPSRRESFSSVTAEALACGTPVVATRCGGPEEILRPDTGLVVDPESPDSLASALERVLAGSWTYDPAVLRASVVDRFGRSAVARRLGDVYERALARGPELAR